MTRFALHTSLLLTLTLALGCGDADKPAPAPNSTPAPATSSTPAKDDHGHKHAGHGAGPHEGTLADWGGGKYHVEFTVDHGQKRATVYILDGKAKKAVPIDAETITLVLKNVQPPANVTLKADPQKDDPKGMASRFVGQHDALAKEMEFKGEISAKVGDKPYTGEFEEKAHTNHKRDKK